MSRVCEICGKKPRSGNNVAHSKVTTKRWWKPNVQKVKVIMPDGKVKRIYVCTKCLRSGKVKRAV